MVVGGSVGRRRSGMSDLNWRRWGAKGLWVESLVHLVLRRGDRAFLRTVRSNAGAHLLSKHPRLGRSLGVRQVTPMSRERAQKCKARR